MLLGMTTDTQDSSGELLEDCAAVVPEADLRAAVSGFVGICDQIPPMYSAVKIGGKKLYELARQGRQVERPARRVTIHEIQILSVTGVDDREALMGLQTQGLKDTKAPGIPFKTLPEQFPKISVTMRVRCSKGTYIRTLCEDIGKKLGTGGVMCALTRTRSGSFALDQALTLEQIEDLATGDALESAVCPVDAMFGGLLPLWVNETGDRLLHNGNPLRASGIRDGLPERLSDRERFRVYDAGGSFTAIYEYRRGTGEFKVVKMFL